MNQNLVRFFVFLYFPLLTNAQEKTVQYFGHRGCRGLMPENTIESFQKAIDLGIDGIELDVVVNKENQLVISHEPYFKSTFCLDSSGNEIKDEKHWNIYEMTQSEINKFDCGSKKHPIFKDQIKFKTRKPLLKELFDAVDLSESTILFEIKSKKNNYGKSQPYPAEFVKLIASEIVDFPFRTNIIFMSFDTQILEEINYQLPSYKCIYLTFLPFKRANYFQNQLSFKPYGLGMFHKTISKRHVQFLHENNMKLFAWTVNNSKVNKKLIRRKVDGIITDFPDRIKN